MKNIEKTLYIDALALVPEKKSGVGVTLEQTLKKLLKTSELKQWKVCLVVPLGKAKYLKKYQSANVQIKTIYLPARALALLLMIKLLPPMDWFLGTGVYLFPNYRNWSVWRSRSITYVYDIAYLKHPETVQVRNQKYLHRFMPSWVRRTDRVVTISDQVKYELEKYLGLAESQIEIVPCGVDRSVFYKRDGKEIETVKKKYSIPYDKYFLFIGNIEPRKNLVNLLNAYNKLPAATQAEYGLVFVGGEGWQNEEFYQELKKMQSAQKNVFKTSKYVIAADLPALYSGATMLIHPAIYEGFGMTPLEAMACGTPATVSDTPAIREVVQDMGVYFDPYSVQSIAGAISKTLSDTKLIAANVERGLTLAKEFSWERSAKELFKVVGKEQESGAHGHPILVRLKRLYQITDGKLLYLFGERAYPPYEPADAQTAHQLRETIFDDFTKEQPARLQLFLKKVYLGTKHSAARILKRSYHLVRGSSK